jgi:predicted alpha/beta superfamily hydrolase
MARSSSTTKAHVLELGHFHGHGIHGRRVRAYVPRAPQEVTPPIRRPVLLLFDGQNVFGDDGSFAGAWHAAEAVDRLAAMGKVRDPEGRRRNFVAPVVLALDHPGAARIDELGAPKNLKLDGLLALVTDQILPAAHAKLSLGYGPSMHVLGGSSMGGLAALYGHFRRPDVFGGALAMSPSLWFQNRGIFDFVRSQSNPYKSRVYLDCGTRESGGRLAVEVSSLHDHLRSRGWSDRGDLRVAVRLDAKGTHNEASWRRRLPKALRTMFGP